MLAFRETKFSRSCRQSYTRLRNGRWLISRSRRLRFSRCWKRRTDYQQNFKAKSRSVEPAWTGQHKGETNGEICIGAWRILRRMDLVAADGPSKGGWPFSGGVQSAAGSEIGRMIIKLGKHDGIRTINVVRRHASVAELERLGADAVIVSTEGPIDEQVRRIVGPQRVKYAIDPVVRETGTQMYQALGEEGR